MVLILSVKVQKKPKELNSKSAEKQSYGRGAGTTVRGVNPF
jgi:hypothetical protein